MPRRSRNSIAGKFAARDRERMISQLREFTVALRAECSVRRRKR